MKKIFIITTVLTPNTAAPQGLPFKGEVPSVSAAWNAIRALRDWDQVPTASLVGTTVTVQEEVLTDGQVKELLPPVINIIFTLSSKGKILFTDLYKYKDRLEKKVKAAVLEVKEEN